VSKPRVATTSLCGCFGCHMSLLDLDERILALADRVEFDRSPIDDYKRITRRCDIGLIEGGCANEDNVEVLREFRRRCDVLVAVGDCALSGGLPAMRNLVPLSECLEESYVRGPSVHNPSGRVPDDKELPLLLDRVLPAHRIVKIDVLVPGCPPSADALWSVLDALLSHREPRLAYPLLKYD
jgi:NAD-reducing hydrogenase small subunit